MNVSGELLAKVTCSSATVGVVPSTLTNINYCQKAFSKPGI